MGEFRMPSLGADMDEGTIVEWRVTPGEEVHRGDIIAVVETEKSDLDVEVFESGVVERIVVPEGEKVAVGTVLAVLVPSVVAANAPTAGSPPIEGTVPGPGPPLTPAAVPASSTEPQEHLEPAVLSPVIRHLADRLEVDLGALRPTGSDGRVHRDDVERAAAARRPRPARPARPARPVSTGDRRRRISPRARRLAAELGVDLAAVTGTGPGAAVVGSDVLAVGPTAPAPSPVEDRVEGGVERVDHGGRPPRRASRPDRVATRRRAIGQLMTRSWQTIPQYHLRQRISVEASLRWLDAYNAAAPAEERILPAALLLRAVALGAAGTPGINGFFVDDRFQPADEVHLGVAVALRDGGLLTPCIHGAHEMTLPQLMAALRDLVNRARAGRLRASDTTGATITVTNLGDVGVDEVTGVIFPPQVAIVGFGAIKEEPWATAGMLGVQRVVHATVAADHRANDGRVGGAFLAAVDRILQEPDRP